jgi:hypothetical protein
MEVVGPRKDASTSGHVSIAGQTERGHLSLHYRAKRIKLGVHAAYYSLCHGRCRAGGAVLTAYEEHVGTCLGARTACLVDADGSFMDAK